jgi:penicillin-binding protein 2
VHIAGKTGTAQKRVLKDGQVGTINFAWFVCFAPADKPEIAVAVMLEGDTIGESFGGGLNSAPVANLILRKYFEKRDHPSAFVQPFRAP